MLIKACNKHLRCGYKKEKGELHLEVWQRIFMREKEGLYQYKKDELKRKNALPYFEMEELSVMSGIYVPRECMRHVNGMDNMYVKRMFLQTIVRRREIAVNEAKRLLSLAENFCKERNHPVHRIFEMAYKMAYMGQAPLLPQAMGLLLHICLKKGSKSDWNKIEMVTPSTEECVLIWNTFTSEELVLLSNAQVIIIPDVKHTLESVCGDGEGCMMFLREKREGVKLHLFFDDYYGTFIEQYEAKVYEESYGYADICLPESLLTIEEEDISEEMRQGLGLMCRGMSYENILSDYDEVDWTFKSKRNIEAFVKLGHHVNCGPGVRGVSICKQKYLKRKGGSTQV